MNYKNIFYILACLSFSIIIGAGVYEHIALWPTAFSELPRSLTTFQGEYKMDNGQFWMKVHPVTLLLFIICAILSRKTERSRYVTIPMITYIIVLALTFIYFVPELMSLVKMPYSNTVDIAASARAKTWIILSLVRLAVLIAAGLILYNGLTKNMVRKEKIATLASA